MTEIKPSSHSTPPRAYRLLALTLLVQMLIIGAGLYCFGFFVVQWIAEFSAQRSQLMLGYFAMTLMAGILAPVAGGWIDKYSHRTLLLLGIAAFALAQGLLAMADNSVFIVSVYACMLPFALILAGPLIAQTMVAQAFVARRGMALGICALGTSLGGFMMPLLITSALDVYHWRHIFWVLAAVAVAIMPVVYWILDGKKALPQQKASQAAAMTNGQLFRDANLYKLAFAYFVPATLFIGVLQNVGLHANDLSISQTQAGVIVSMAAGLMAGGKLLVGWLADKVSHGLLYFALLMIIAMSLILSAMAPEFYSLALGVALLGTSVGGLTPLMNMLVVQRYGMANFGRVMGVVMGCASFSGAAPFIVSWLRDYTGSYQTAFLWFLPLVIPAAIAFARLAPVKASKTQG